MRRIKRSLASVSAMVGVALGLGGPASADLSISLVQIGGTYSASLGANPGDTLVLAIDYFLTNTGTLTTFSLIDPSLKFDPAVATLTGGAETGAIDWTDGAGIEPSISFAPIVQNTDIQASIAGDGSTVANGWEKATLNAGGVTAPCLPGVALHCTRLGNATFTLSGVAGVIDSGGVVNPAIAFATTIGDGAFVNRTSDPGVSLGVFTIVPEPTPASLLALGLVGLARRTRRRNR